MRLIDKNRSTLRDACPSATLSTTNPTWTGLGLYLDLDSKRLVINHLHHGIALINHFQFVITYSPHS
jgi:hypothetical protein